MGKLRILSDAFGQAVHISSNDLLDKSHRWEPHTEQQYTYNSVLVTLEFYKIILSRAHTSSTDP